MAALVSDNRVQAAFRSHIRVNPAYLIVPGCRLTFRTSTQSDRVTEKTQNAGVRGDRIVAVGRLTAATAKREIDARGLVVAPGDGLAEVSGTWTVFAGYWNFTSAE